MAKEGTSFEKLLTDAIDAVLLSLGESARQAIYFHLEDKYKITRGEIPNRLEDFQNGLEKIFGETGTTYLEILMMKKLHEEIGKPLEWNENKDLAFIDYVAATKQTYSKTKD